MSLFDPEPEPFCAHGRPGGRNCPACIDDARHATDAAVARADLNADREWRSIAYEAVVACAGRGPFTADDVWAILDYHDASTHEPAALGPVFRRAAADGLIVKTGRLVPSRLTRRHRDLTEWAANPGSTDRD